MAYYPNDTQKYINKSNSKNVTNIIEDYFLERKALKTSEKDSSTNYHSSFSSLNSSTNNYKFNSSYNSFYYPASSSVLSKIQDYTRVIKGRKRNEKLEQLNKKLINNVNVMNIRYQDTNSNNYFICNLNEFKQVCSYNSKAQEIYSKDLHPNKGFWRINTSDKVFRYRKYFE